MWSELLLLHFCPDQWCPDQILDPVLVLCVAQSANGYPMEPSRAAVAAVEWALRRLCSYLLNGALAGSLT